MVNNYFFWKKWSQMLSLYDKTNYEVTIFRQQIPSSNMS